MSEEALKQHARAEEFLQSRIARNEVAQTDCESGCSYCCHQPATVFTFEARRIAEVMDPALVPKMRERVAGLKGKSVAQNINNKTPCPLLVDDKCSVYDERPLTCRMAHSFSKKKCRASFEGDRHKVGIPVSYVLQHGLSQIIEDVFAREKAMYELCSAVLAVIDGKDFKNCVKDDT